jgi:ABC-2 type transport system ATP-binding protein
MAVAIAVEGVSKRYGATVALDDVSLEVGEGEVLGVVGPNGAGKTTLLECLSGLRRPDRGRIAVFGRDPRDRRGVARVLGMQLQSCELPDRLRVNEAFELYAAIYGGAADRGLLETLGLAGCVRTACADLSGGQRQRLSIALALVGHPQGIVLDELTTGLDPQARRAVWEVVDNLKIDGLTVVVSTHYMEEAERLCDRVAVIARGRLVAVGTPPQLVRRARAGSSLDEAYLSLTGEPVGA